MHLWFVCGILCHVLIVWCLNGWIDCSTDKTDCRRMESSTMCYRCFHIQVVHYTWVMFECTQSVMRWHAIIDCMVDGSFTRWVGMHLAFLLRMLLLNVENHLISGLLSTTFVTNGIVGGEVYGTRLLSFLNFGLLENRRKTLLEYFCPKLQNLGMKPFI